MSVLSAAVAGSVLAAVALVPAPAPAQRPAGPRRVPATASPASMPADPPSVERAVTRGLDFLENAQQPGGFWQNRNRQERVETTGWALMAYLASGHTPRAGRYRQTVEKALAWFAAAVRDDMDALQPREIVPGWRRHYDWDRESFSLFVLLTAVGTGTETVHDEDLVISAERGLKKVLALQSRKEEVAAGTSLRHDFTAGGWGQVEESYWFTLCLLAARQAGMKVPRIALENARQFWVRHYQPQYGSFYDQLGHPYHQDVGKNTYATFSGRVLTVLVLLGEDPAGKMMRDALKVLQDCDVDNPDWFWNYGGEPYSGHAPSPASKNSNCRRGTWGGHSRFMSQWYLAQRLCGVKGPQLERARETFTRHILFNQTGSGAFRLPGWQYGWPMTEQYGTPNWLGTLGYAKDWGDEMTTAHAVYALAIPKGYIPAFTRWEDKQ